MAKKVELVLLLLFITALMMLNRNLDKFVTSDAIKVSRPTIVLDAGHGGSDPGKVGINGALEKDINLQISLKVKELLEEKEFKVIMTREQDEMLCKETADNKKQEDMRKRVDIINEARPALAVSIHQNSYTEAEVSGAQVFYYSESVEGKQMAECIQNALLEADADNKRMVKSNDSYYLLRRTKVPTIIIECGFLSNPQEAEKLTTNDYQETIAKAIVKGIESCVGN